MLNVWRSGQGYWYYEDLLKPPPTYSYLAPRMKIIFVVTKHHISYCSFGTIIVKRYSQYYHKNHSSVQNNSCMSAEFFQCQIFVGFLEGRLRGKDLIKRTKHPIKLKKHNCFKSGGATNGKCPPPGPWGPWTKSTY